MTDGSICLDSSISIHALLAESDGGFGVGNWPRVNFYPRSPCGERRWYACSTAQTANFYPRSPCGERPEVLIVTVALDDFYPRSPCGERPNANLGRHRVNNNFYPRSPCGERQIVVSIGPYIIDFYPRSPCGERLSIFWICRMFSFISIHALLAESDYQR